METLQLDYRVNKGNNWLVSGSLVFDVDDVFDIQQIFKDAEYQLSGVGYSPEQLTFKKLSYYNNAKNVIWEKKI